MGGKEKKEEGDVPCGIEAFLGFPCPARRSVRHLAHAGDV